MKTPFFIGVEQMTHSSNYQMESIKKMRFNYYFKLDFQTNKPIEIIENTDSITNH